MEAGVHVPTLEFIYFPITAHPEELHFFLHVTKSSEPQRLSSYHFYLTPLGSGVQVPSSPCMFWVWMFSRCFSFLLGPPDFLSYFKDMHCRLISMSKLSVECVLVRECVRRVLWWISTLSKVSPFPWVHHDKPQVPCNPVSHTFYPFIFIFNDVVVSFLLCHLLTLHYSSRKPHTSFIILSRLIRQNAERTSERQKNF